MEDTFPQAFIERVNSKKRKRYCCRSSLIKWFRTKMEKYAVIIDRISRCTFYRAYLKNVALTELTS
jgi:hypothetical protein